MYPSIQAASTTHMQDTNMLATQRAHVLDTEHDRTQGLTHPEQTSKNLTNLTQ